MYVASKNNLLHSDSKWNAGASEVYEYIVIKSTAG
jgi:hypothetical protein